MLLGSSDETSAARSSSGSIPAGVWREMMLPVIRRSWHGAVPEASGDAFERHLRGEIAEEIEDAPGNLGVFLRRATDGNLSHFFLLTYWDDWASIRRFAGATPHLAVTYPDDAAFGLVSDPIVLHQECSTIEPWFGEA